LIKSITKSHIQ